jgi:ATP-dependent DNA helicase RecG
MSEIRKHLRDGESVHVEFLGTIPDPLELARHVVGMLNATGGSIYIGVDDRGEVLGVSGAEDSRAELQRKVNELISPSALFDVVPEDVDGRTVLTVIVPPGASGPYMCDGKIMTRESDATRLATIDEVHRWLQRSVSEAVRWERRPAVELSKEDLDLQEVRRTTQEPESRVRLQTESGHGPEGILKAFGMMSQGRYTNAADVCFGKDPSIRNAQVRLRAFAFEKGKGGDYRDHRDIHGPIAAVIEQAVAFVRRNTWISAEFLDGALRRDVSAEYPLQALREGVVNAMAHRDYASFSSGATIMLYPDRLEIWNSGALPEGWKAGNLKRDHPSLPKNPDIAHYLYVRGYMERIGRGTQKIMDACTAVGLKAPAWKVDRDGVTLVIYAAKPQGPKSPKLPELNERMLQFLQTVVPGQSVTTLVYTRRVTETITERQARRDLQDLVELGFLKKEGSTKATRYIRTDKQAPEPPSIRT